jgi:hypothetical protein
VITSFDKAADIADMGVEIDGAREEVSAFAEPGEARHEDLVAHAPQNIGNRRPARARTPGTLHQNDFTAGHSSPPV